MPDLWYVSFYGLEENARFSPMELVITSGGQDFRPLDVIPLSTGFGEQRLRQRETQSAVYLYSGDIDVDHPLTVDVSGSTQCDLGAASPANRRERALIRARASRKGFLAAGSLQFDFVAESAEMSAVNSKNRCRP